MQISARRLFRSVWISVLGLILSVGIVAYTAKAANYTVNLNTAAPVNWTAAAWGCGTAGVGDVCGTYPGQLVTPFPDNANIGGAGTMHLTTSLPNAINAFNMTNGVGVNLFADTGGVLRLNGTSLVTGTSGANSLQLNGGTITNNGLLQVTSSGQPQMFQFAGGTLNGTGTTSIGSSGTLAITGTQGAMVISQQAVNNAATVNYSSSVNSLAMGNGAVMTNTFGATFNANGSAPIVPGAGASRFENMGNLTNPGLGPFTLAIPFVNTSTASLFSTGSTFNFTGGSALTGHSNAAWGLDVSGIMNFGGSHVFINGQNFNGLGSVNINAGGQWTVDTTPATLTFPSGISMQNDGTLDFGTTTHALTFSGGTWKQNATGTVRFKLGPSPGISDAINVTGTGTFAGTLVAVLATGYTPGNGDTFTVITDTAQSGTFTYTPLAYSNGHFQIVYNPTSVQLVAVPEADLGLTITPTPAANAGSTFTDTVNITNNGPSSSTVTVSLTLTNGTISAVSGGALFSCSNTATTATCTSLSPLPAPSTSPITVTIVAPAQAGTTTLNGTVTGAPADPVPDPTPNSGSGSTAIAALTDVSITKTATSPVVAGQNVTYSIVVTNGGPSDAASVSVTDTPGAGLTFVSNSGACTTVFPCNFPTLAAGSSVTITSTYALAANATGTVSNTAGVTTTTPESNSGNNSATVSNAITTSADVVVTKALSGSLVAGSNATYNITVQNVGPSDATSVTVTDTPGAGLTFVSNSGACTTTFPCSFPTLAAGASVTITSTYAVAANASGTITNTANATASTSDPAAGNNTSTASNAVGTSADLSIVKALTSTLVAGSNATYSITVTNNGPSDAAAVVVNDTPGAGLTFVSNTGACTTAFPCNLGTMAAGASVTINSTFAVAPTATGSISNTATVSTTATPDPSSANNSSTATGTVGTNADVAVLKTAIGSATPGSPITFTIDVKNFGPSDASGVVVTDTPGTGLTFVSNSGACSTAFPCNIGTLTAGATVTITSVFQVAPTATGSVTNTASVTSTSTDPLPSNNSATASAPVVAVDADLSITKTGPAALPATGSVTFTITVRNNGPAPAFNVAVNDAASRLVFVSNTGACSTPFPCSLGTLAAGATASISSTFTVTPGAQFASNSASVSATSPDPNSANNSATVTLGQSCPNVAPQFISPLSGQTDVALDGSITWSSAGANSYDVYFGKKGAGCTNKVATVAGTSFSYSGLDPNTDYEVRVVAIRSGCPAVSSVCLGFRTTQGSCFLSAPTLLSPKDGTKVTSPLKLQWGSVAGAESYHVVVAVDGQKTVDTTTTSTSLDVTVDNGAVTWSVTAIAGNCTSPPSNGTFNICSTPATPVAGVVGAPSAGRTYQVVVFNPSPTSVHIFEEADNDSFQNARSQSTSSPFVPYAHPASQTAQVFFYRVRALNECGLSGFSKVLRVVILPAVVTTRPVLNVPAGTRDEQVLQIFIPGESERLAFTATTDRPWITRIDPSSGILPTEGITLNLHIDPSQLPNGTFTASVIITTSPLSSGRITPHAGGKKSAPVTINLITPVVPVDSSAISEDSLVIPAVGHLVGLNSQWRSDVRIFNPSAAKMKYVLNFLAVGSSDVKQTTIETDAGATTALDDIIHNWYGVGEVGDSATGVLQVVPVKDSGQSALASIVASRTYSLAGEGTLGEFIPGVPLKQFAGSGSRMSLQQIAQTSSFRTNFGLVEATGKPASLLLTMFNSAGTKLFDLPVNLAANEQKLLNGLLTQQGVSSLTDGRMEVQVTGGDGKITAYASVIDNSSQNPLFVPGQPLGNDTAQLYVVPGVADLNNGAANWRSDMRIFNASSSPQSAELAFYPSGAGALPFFATVSINPGEVKVLDNLLQSTFGTSNNGGAVHINTTNASQLVVTARTYNQTAAGTLGQFVPGSTLADAIDKSAHSLNILQVEDSMRFRTNVGLAEMTGKPATVEISVILPDSKVTPTIEVPLAGNEFRQFGLSAFGLGNVYNARVSVRVINGDGSVTAYGSVIDQITSAPTYVAAK